MNFLAHLEQIEPGRCAIVTAAERISFGALCTRAHALRQGLGGARVVLCTDDLIGGVCMLAAADDHAAAAILVSAWQLADVVAPLIELARPNVVVGKHRQALTDAGLPKALLHATPELAVQALAEGTEPGDRETGAATGWVLTTSGTTGKPKMVQHSFTGLTRSTRRDQDRGSTQVWGLLYDYSRFAGLQVVLQSLLSGARLVVPSYEASLEDKLAFLAAEGCTHLSATPTMLRKILMTPRGAGLPLRQITLGGEIADAAVLASLARAFPEARISHVFASTEAGVGFSVADRQEGFPTAYLSDPPSKIGLRIAEGRLWVRNEAVGTTYLGDQGVLSQGGWVDTGDRVEVVGDRVFFRGRESGVINIGGDKVHPEEVERAILTHPDVALVRVYAKSNPIMGALVAADIVARPDSPPASALRASVTAHLKTRLEKHMIPVTMRFLESLDTNPAGKLQRNA